MERLSAAVSLVVRLTAGAAVALFTASPPAQVASYSFAPSRYAAREGSSWSAFPFLTISRLQCLYHGAAATTAYAGRIALRGEGGAAHAGLQQVELEIRAGGSPNAPFAMSPSFPANRGPDFATVLRRKKVDLPALVGLPGPQQFDIEFLLDTPMTRTMSPHLLVEFIVTAIDAASAQGYDLDAAGYDPPAFAHTGANCNNAIQLVTAQITASRSLLDWFFASSSAFAGGAGLLLFGTAPLPQSVPLPFPGGCSLHQDIAAHLPLVLDSRGGAKVSLPVPVWSKGVQVQTQIIALTPSLSAVAATQTTRTTIGGLDAVAQCLTQAFTNVNGVITVSETGTVGVGGALVLRFD